MPGPVSDSYDPEFGTAENAHAVDEAIQRIIDRIPFGALKNIVTVVRSEDGPAVNLGFSEREWRIVRFALLRALESI